MLRAYALSRHWGVASLVSLLSGGSLLGVNLVWPQRLPPHLNTLTRIFIKFEYSFKIGAIHVSRFGCFVTTDGILPFSTR